MTRGRHAHGSWLPGLEWEMQPRPIFENRAYVGSGKLKGRVALITGGDSGIGRAVAVAFAKVGADVAISYLYEERDAAETAEAIQRLGRRCLALAGDIRDPEVCRRAVAAAYVYLASDDSGYVTGEVLHVNGGQYRSS